MSKYITKSGEMWDQIALEHYGSEAMFTKLIEANLDYVNVLVFSAGVELDIPEIVSTEKSLTPPWGEE